jgi:hypothetical protein
MKSKYVPVYVMKVYNRSGGTDPFILKLGNKWAEWLASPSRPLYCQVKSSR